MPIPASEYDDTPIAAGATVVVVGGGYSAATLAIQLIRAAATPLFITIVEPRAELGRGLAYSAGDPDHRLNGPVDSHGLDPARPSELLEWCRNSRVAELDPECVGPAGHMFLRRGDFGAYVSDIVRRHSDDVRSGSRICHVRDVAIDLERIEGGYRVRTRTTGCLVARLVVIATGNAIPSLRAPFAPEHADHPSIIADPLEPDCLDRISPKARTLIVGGGLTSLDVASTLIRRDHAAPIVIVSRRGLRPRPHSPAICGQLPLSAHVAAAKQTEPANCLPDFLEGQPVGLLSWLRALRREIVRIEKKGGSWHEPFDKVRDAAWILWPKLPTAQKIRFLRRLRLFYDVHRFRAPIMNDNTVRAAEARGAIRFEAASLTSVTPRAGDHAVIVGLKGRGEPERSETFGAVINCTGTDSVSSCRGNPFLAAALAKGFLTPHPTGLGFSVSAACEAQAGDGSVQPMLRVIGPPPALGALGDPAAAVFIAAQVRRLIPGLAEALGVQSGSVERASASEMTAAMADEGRG